MQASPDTGGAPAKLAVDGLYKIYGPRPRAALDALLAAGPASGRLGPHTVALRGVSFTVAPGEIFVVMGLSGSGKSTLVRCVNRLIEPTAGTVTIDGQDVTAMAAGPLREVRRRKVGMVFQHFALLPHRTVRDNVAFGLELRGEPARSRLDQADAALELVGLGQWGRSYPEQLSGGMRQRVGLARALATDPDILLMDEPFSALDPLIRRRMQDELLDLQDRLNKTILFITHDLDEALRLGNRVAMMRAGEMVQVAGPEDILLHPADDYVAAFVRHVDRSRVLRARDVMIPARALLRLAHAPRVALREMEQQGLSSAFVLGPLGRFRGMVSADDIVAAAQRGDPDLGSILRPDGPVVTPDQSLRSLIPLAAATGHPLPVVDSAGGLLGIVARVALLRALVDDGEPEQASHRPALAPEPLVPAP